MIDPQAARQAVQAWKRLRGSIAAGDALAGLVPQLLQELEEMTFERDDLLAEKRERD